MTSPSPAPDRVLHSSLPSRLRYRRWYVKHDRTTVVCSHRWRAKPHRVFIWSFLFVRSMWVEVAYDDYVREGDLAVLTTLVPPIPASTEEDSP